MRPDTKRHFHLGVNFIVAPAGSFDRPLLLQFEQALVAPERGIIFDGRAQEGAHSILTRRSPPLQVRLGAVGPQVAQILITSPRPEGRLEDFAVEADDVITAFREVWGQQPLQVLRRDCTIRHLYAVGEPHSFQYLWERRLRQSPETLAALERPVLGGGIRLAMPARPDEPDDPAMEVKVETLFEDPSQLFVEAQVVWERPTGQEGFNAEALLNYVESYLDVQVRNFILADEQ